MAIISKEQIGFETGSFLRVIKVNSEGTFSIELPEPVKRTVGFGVVEAESKDAALRMFGEALKKHRESRSTKRKVILFHIERTAYVWRNDKCVLNATGSGGGRTVAFAKGVALAVAANVFEETRIEMEGDKVRFNYDILPSTLPKSMQEGREIMPVAQLEARNKIDWTEERETFFARLGLAIENIILELEKLDSPETVSALIEAGGFKMLGGPK